MWDLILLEGNEILLRTALAIWQALADRIMGVRSADEFYSIMGVLTREMLEFGFVDANVLVRSVAAIGTLSELKNLREHYLYNINPWSSSEPSAATVPYDDDDDKRLNLCPREKLVLDIGVLKKQYSKLKQRQRQAHIIFNAAVSRQPQRPTPVAMNHLLLGKSALVSVRRLGPPPGSVPPPRQQQSATLHWKDEPPRQSSSSSSSDTELCDDPEHLASDEEDSRKCQVERGDEIAEEPPQNFRDSSPTPSNVTEPASSLDETVPSMTTTSKDYDTCSDDGFDFEKFLEERIRCLKSDAVERDEEETNVPGDDSKTDTDNATYPKRSSERALEIIQENSLILHRMLQCHSRFSPSTVEETRASDGDNPGDEFTWAGNSSCEDPRGSSHPKSGEEHVEIFNDPMTQNQADTQHSFEPFKYETLFIMAERSTGGVKTATFGSTPSEGGNFKNVESAFSSRAEDTRGVKFSSGQAFDVTSSFDAALKFGDVKTETCELRFETKPSETSSEVSTTTSCVGDATTSAFSSSSDTWVIRRGEDENVKVTEVSNTYPTSRGRFSMEDHSSGFGFDGDNVDASEPAEYLQGEFRNEDVTNVVGTTSPGGETDTRTSYEQTSKYKSILDYSKDLDEKYNALILNAPASKNVQQNQNASRTLHLPLSPDDSRISGDNQKLASPSRLKDPSPTWRSSASKRSPSKEFAGTSPTRGSPNHIFNPFPVMLSSRQNKDVAVKLGLYKK